MKGCGDDLIIEKATWKARGNTIHTPWQVKRNNSCHPHAVTQHLRQVVSLTLTGSKVFLGFWNVTVLLCFWIKELWQIYIYKKLIFNKIYILQVNAFIQNNLCRYDNYMKVLCQISDVNKSKQYNPWFFGFVKISFK